MPFVCILDTNLDIIVAIHTKAITPTLDLIQSYPEIYIVTL